MSAGKTMRAQLRENADRAIVLGAVLAYVGLALWCVRNGGPLPPDGLEIAEAARSLAGGQGYTIDMVEIHAGLLPAVRHLHELHGLLAPLLVAPFFVALGPSTAFVSVPSILLAAGTALISFALAKHCFGKVAGIVAAAFMLVDPILISCAIVGGTDDVGSTFFSTAAIYCVLRSQGDARRRWIVLAAGAVALATLHKPSGVVVLCPLAVLTVAHAGWRRGFFGPRFVALVLSGVAAAALYGLRNFLLHRHAGFRYSALDWFSKDSPQAYFAFYERAPGMGRVIRELGWSRIGAITLAQFRLLGSVVQTLPLSSNGGFVALFVLFRRRAALAIPALGYVLALCVVVCVAYHVEVRYFLPLHPLFAVALGGALCTGVTALQQRTTATGWTRAGAALVIAIFAVGFVLSFDFPRRYERAASDPIPCAPAMAFIRERVPVTDPVFTSSPWFVTWNTGRPSVNVPTNGTDALVRVAEHYGVEWAVTGMWSYGAADVFEAVTALGRSNAPIRPELAFIERNCSVYRLRRLEP